MISRLERILILCKTYLSPSAKHVETSCVAGINESGDLICIYPMPFRLMGDEQKFKKWQKFKGQARISQKSASSRPLQQFLP